jgi:hypothetical protein
LPQEVLEGGVKLSSVVAARVPGDLGAERTVLAQQSKASGLSAGVDGKIHGRLSDDALA